MIIKKHPILLSVISIALVAALWLLISWVVFLRSSVIVDDQGVKYVVPDGASMQAVVKDLHVINVIKHPWFFSLLVYLKGNKHDLKAGEYLFPKGSTSPSILKQITTGSGMIYHTFTIVAGWSFKHLRGVLLHDDNLRHLAQDMDDQAIMKQMGHPEMNPEGEFFPDTYFFVKGSSDIALLKRAFRMMQTKLDDAWKHRAPNLPYKSPLEALTAASLIEKETGIDPERPVIAGVIVNRLKKNMLLQIDPTVIYAAGANFSGTIHKSDLLSKNPYNTYTHKGLPPTPIAIPGFMSIKAALHPQHHDYLYFVAKNYNFDGSHQFSATLAEHYSAITKAKQREFQLGFFNTKLVQYYFLKLALMKIYK